MDSKFISRSTCINLSLSFQGISVKVENANFHQARNLHAIRTDPAPLEPAGCKLSKSVSNVEIGPADQKLVFYAPIGPPMSLLTSP